jgi:hypothetical protein
VLPVSVAVVPIWIALGVLLVAVVGGIAYAAVRGWQLYRTARSSGAVITAEMDRISAVTLQIEEQMAKAEASAARLNAATGRLATSRAQLDVQLAAVRQARAQVRRVFWFVPGI